MSETLLQTKLFIPPLRPNLVPRPQLIERLNQGRQLGHKLSLISASAGFGKTTLISEWVAASQSPVAWLSLDEGDDDPNRFLAYLVAALQTIYPNVGDGGLAWLQSNQPPPIESLLTTLLNEIAGVPDNFIFVLDDYHAIDSQPIDTILSFLLEHLPPQMHLVVTTREDPSLPLARYRARNQMTELRATDLRFSPAEATGFLNQAMGLNLRPENVAALEARTEGWIAGLQMAALALQGLSLKEQADTAGFVQAFTGSHRFVLDYLVEEVLQQQPTPVREFLLQTSILDRLCGPLCDAVTGQEDGKSVLATLERGNLFILPLDGQRQWYRYHHLFADVLQAHLQEELPRQVPGLHQRASAWHEQNGFTADAIRHALAAEDFERAAGLIELAWPAMDSTFQSNVWLRWARALPPELVPARPVLNVAYAWAKLNLGELEAAESRLQDAESRLERAELDQRQDGPASDMAIADDEQFRALPASIASARAYIAQARGDVPGTAIHARQALDLLPDDDYIRRGPAAALLGLADWGRGDLDNAYQALAEAMQGFQMAGAISFAISGTYGLADIRIAQGRLREALGIYEQALQLVGEHKDTTIRGTADLYLGLSMLYREWGNLAAASENLSRSLELGEQLALDNWPIRIRVAQARFKEDQGDLDRALDLLNEARRLYFRSPVPDLRPIATLKTLIWLKQDRLEEAWSWCQEQDLSVTGELSYLREFDYLTLARVLIARSQIEGTTGPIRQAIALLERLRKAAEEGRRMGSLIEILVVQALANQALGELASAIVPLKRALALAEPEGYVRIFVDEGALMEELLREATERGAASKYIGRLQAAFDKDEVREPVSQPMIEPLSQRELEVLALLGTDLSGPEIARELMVSPNTMRTHTRNIYSKLGVHNRRAAVRRAEELDLL